MKEKLHNTFYYSFGFNNPEKLASNALELSVGDIIFEFFHFRDLVENVDLMLEKYNNPFQEFTLHGNKKPISDKIISRIASLILGSQIITMLDFPRLSKRESLSPWIDVKTRDKFIKLALLYNENKINFVSAGRVMQYSKKRHFRKSIRSLIYVSTFPLRIITFFSLLGSLISILVSFYVLVYKLKYSAIEGWATTNLIISGSSFFILSTLGIISEYLNQIISNNRVTGKLNIVHEFSSNSKTFNLNDNIEQV